MIESPRIGIAPDPMNSHGFVTDAGPEGGLAAVENPDPFLEL